MAFSAHRPLIAVQNVVEAKADDKKEDAKVEQLALPFVFLAPIRPDIVHFVHTNMAKNRRQPYAVSEKAGHQHSAESWGTGRAVARVPRVSGGGTSRAGQGAFANMCRKGRMYAPTKIWRKWHRKINTNQKRFAVASALAASAVPALVMARGHKIDGVPEVPLVVDSSAEAVKKTKDAIKILKSVGAYSDVEKAHESRKIRRGVGKMRNRRHVSRRGPLVVYAEDNGVTKAFRNLPGVELASVDRLNLLQLAPGGHLGRFIIWTRAAFAKLNKVYGTVSKPSEVKVGYTLPRNIMSNSDITRLINSDEVQSKLRPAIKSVKRAVRKKNPLTNLGAKIRLNPYTITLRRSEVVAEQRRATAKQAALAAARDKKAAPLTQDQKNTVAGTQREAAVARTHEPQQRENYKRLIQGEAYTAPVDKDGVPVALKVQKSRASIKGVFPKVERKEKKPRKHKKVVEVEKKEAIPVVAAKKLPKIAKEKKVKVKKEPKAKKEDKKAAGGKEEKGKAEAGKKEEAKKGGAAPKEEAKKAAGGKGGKK